MRASEEITKEIVLQAGICSSSDGFSVTRLVDVSILSISLLVL